MMALVGAETRTRALGRGERLLGLCDPAARHERDGRIAGAMLLLGGAYSAVVAASAHRPSAQLAVAAGWLTGALLCFTVAWAALPRWTVHAPAWWAISLLSIGAGLGGTLTTHAVGYVLVFAYVGLVGRPVDALWTTALAEVGLVAAMLVGQQRTERAAAVAAIVLAALAGQLVALVSSWHRRATRRVGLLRSALADLVAAGSEAEVAGRVAGAAVHLLDADEAVVVVTEHPGSTVLAGVGGSHARPEYTKVRIDTNQEQSGAAVAARSGLSLFIADAPTSPVAARRLVTEFAAASVLYLPIPGEGGVMGTIVIWWRRPRASVDPFAQQVAELLTAPAGQVLQRLRHLGQLAKPELKDDLTGLGNRRRFDGGLTELPAGGAILLFDLDALRDVNSRHGLDNGDETLRGFADALRRSVRDNDIVARFGGDDFGVILPVVSSPIVGGIIIERLQRIWRSPFGCQFSVGIAIRSADESPSDTLRRAEADLLASKALKSGAAG